MRFILRAKTCAGRLRCGLQAIAVVASAVAVCAHASMSEPPPANSRAASAAETPPESPAETPTPAPAQTPAVVASRNYNVLFFDLNNAESEITQFKNELPRDSHKIFLLPSMSRLNNDARKRVVQIHRDIESTTLRASNCAPITKANRAQCHAMWDRLLKLEREREATTGRIMGPDLFADLRQSVGDHVIDIAVISGHHQRRFFRGELAEMTDDELLDMAAQMPNSFQQVRTAILLGCDTGTPDVLTKLFRRVFPNATLIIGSELPAPTRDQPNNLAFIRELLRHENTLLSATSRDEVSAVFEHLYAQRWPVTILWKQQEFFSDDWQHFADPARSHGLSIVPRTYRKGLVRANPVSSWGTTPIASTSVTPSTDTFPSNNLGKPLVAEPKPVSAAPRFEP